MRADLQEPMNLIDIYNHKASLSLNDSCLCPAKILDKKFFYHAKHVKTTS